MGKQYKYWTVQVTVVHKESLIRHVDRIREERVLKHIQGKQEWNDHTRRKV